jgi:tripartite-type tricarboxylate transporter receptor subunit TctC
MFVPAKTPAPVVARLHDETVNVLRSDALRERLAGLGAEVAPMEQPQFAALVSAEAAQAAALIKRAGIRVD